jgi:hypothetical protein
LFGVKNACRKKGQECNVFEATGHWSQIESDSPQAVGHKNYPENCPMARVETKTKDLYGSVIGNLKARFAAKRARVI